jgi:hypothetical protein
MVLVGHNPVRFCEFSFPRKSSEEMVVRGFLEVYPYQESQFGLQIKQKLTIYEQNTGITKGALFLDPNLANSLYHLLNEKEGEDIAKIVLSFYGIDNPLDLFNPDDWNKMQFINRGIK